MDVRQIRLIPLAEKLMSPQIRTLSYKTSPDFTDLWEQFVAQLIEPDGGHEQA